jgi:hypothetical protein
MFDIEVCVERQIVLVRFHGAFAESDLAGLEGAARATPAAGQYDCVFDFTAVDHVDLAPDFVSRRGDLPVPFQQRQRLYVVPQPDVKLLMRLYAGYQTSKGWRDPTLVDSLEEALGHFGVQPADFQPLAAIRFANPSGGSGSGSR